VLGASRSTSTASAAEPRLLSSFSPIGELSSVASMSPEQVQRVEPARGLRCRARWSVLKIQYTDNGDAVLTVSGRLAAGNLGELTASLDAERFGRPLVLDLKDLILADADAVRLLCACERDGITLRNCPPYIRTWMTRERDRS
jgi:hypothetical protein